MLSKEGEEVVIIQKEKPLKQKRIDELPKPTKTEEKWPLAQREGQLVVDIYERDDFLIIESTIAGVRPQDIDVTVESDLIIIRGERKKEPKGEVRYWYQECFWGKFSRTMVLPHPVKPEKVKASLKNGILTIILPKAEEGKGVEVRLE